MKTFNITIAWAALLLLGGCRGRAPNHLKHEFFRMDTYTTLTVVDQKGLHPEGLWNSVDSLLADWEIRYSQTRPGSELLRLNTRSSSRVPVSPMLGEMISAGLRYGDSLNGLFDLTVLPIKELWGFGEQNPVERVPSRDSVTYMLREVNYRKVKVNASLDSAFFDAPDLRVDAGGVANAFILREMGALLKRAEIRQYLIEAGGDILSQGRRGDATPWRVGVQHPRREGTLLAVLTLDSGAVVTSGDYEHFWMKNGLRYHHIFDTRTGYCANRNQSVTMWGMDPVEIGLVCTGLFALESDSILAYVNARPRLQCIVVDSAGEIGVSRGWKEKVEWVKE